MDFNQFINNLNVKKIAFFIVAGLVGLAIVREIIFFEFVHSFKNVYSQFVTQFNQDQQSIHQVIEDSFKKHKEMEKEMDRRSAAFHNYVDKSFNNILSNFEDKSAPHPEQNKMNTKN